MLSPSKLCAAAVVLSQPPVVACAAARPAAARVLHLARCVPPSLQQQQHQQTQQHGLEEVARPHMPPATLLKSCALAAPLSTSSSDAGGDVGAPGPLLPPLAAAAAAAAPAPRAVPVPLRGGGVGADALDRSSSDSDEASMLLATSGATAAGPHHHPHALTPHKAAAATALATPAPSPDAYTGPPRVPAYEDEPLSLSWVRSLPEVAGPGGGECGSDARVGRIHVVMGPMFAGKSTALLGKVEALEESGRRVALVKSAVDTRYARSWVVTHDGRRARCFATPTLAAFEEELGDLLGRFHAVAIDEAQFFPDLLPFALRQAEAGGRDVLVAGLSCDFMRRRPAPYTVRVVGQDGQQLVGGADIYRPACTRCYHECNAGRGGP